MIYFSILGKTWNYQRPVEHANSGISLGLNCHYIINFGVSMVSNNLPTIKC